MKDFKKSTKLNSGPSGAAGADIIETVLNGGTIALSNIVAYRKAEACNIDTLIGVAVLQRTALVRI